MNMKKISLLIRISLVALLSACGGGGGGSSDGPAADGTVWNVAASVTSDDCRERISPVNQSFIVSESDGALRVNTSVTTAPGTKTSDGFSFSYQEQNGDCLRTYSGVFSNLKGSNAEVKLTSQSQCSGVLCKSEWTGTAVVGSLEPALLSSDISGEAEAKVSGENCVPPTSDLIYRASAFECNGNAWVGMITPRFRSAYSVVLRANGFRNDRDPNNPECGLASCSPYKTQKIIELPEYQVRCLGANGRDAVMARARRISIKFISTLSEADKQDPLKFEQYCLANTARPLN